MSARDRLINSASFYDVENAESIADEILAGHIDELADRIRNSEELRDLTDDHMRDCNAAADFLLSLKRDGS